MDGITLAQRALEADPEIGILFMTGYADVETAKKAIATGAYDYIMKPFELAEIRKSVNAAFAKRKEIQKKQGSKGLQHLSELMGALYTTGDTDSLTRLILRFALFHFGLTEGLVFLYNRSAERLRITMGKPDGTNLIAEIENFPLSDFPSDLLEGGETEHAGEISRHPFLERLTASGPCAKIVEALHAGSGTLSFFSLPATEKLKLILAIRSESEISVNEADRQMLTVLLSLSSISLDNLILLQEAHDAMSRLEDFKDHLVGLERAATQGMISSEIAHELNNFIAIILSNIELFEMKAAGSYPEASVKYLENVKKNIGKFEKFTTSLSDAGKLDTKRQNSDLNEMINEIVTFARHQGRFRKIVIDLELDSTLPRMLIDQSQIQQVLYNMINNAADAIDTERPDGRIKLTTKYDSEKHEFTLVCSDNGCGFSPENLQRAFRDRFTTKEHGHGFGLTVIRKVVRNHGGNIALDSQLGGGASITLSVPIVDPNTVIDSAATAKIPVNS